VICFTLIHRGRTFRVNFELSDYLPLNEEAYKHADLYFKMQLGLEGYGDRSRLVPGGHLVRRPDSRTSPQVDIGSRP
jgi:hypothetical protein